MHSIDEENGVASRRAVIVIRTGYLAVLIPKSNQIHHFNVVLHLHLHQSLEDDSVVELLQSHALSGLLQGIE
jgi:hypothetical protein